MRLGLIGYGNIASMLVPVIERHGVTLDRLDVLARKGRIDAARTAFAQRGNGARTVVHTDAAAFVDAAPDVVVEAAGHGAVGGAVVTCLKAGLPTVIVSTGALADKTIEAAVRDAARQGRTHALLSPGAIGGIDILCAARLSGIDKVTYTSRKPPQAWGGTPADNAVDLKNLTEPVTFYSGNARQAARDFAKNANVAATVALAGAGFEATDVCLIADPSVKANIHELSVRSAALDFTIRLEGKPSPDNPKTSVSTVYALARAVINRAGPLVI